MSASRKIVRRATKEFEHGNQLPLQIICKFAPNAFRRYAKGYSVRSVNDKAK